MTPRYESDNIGSWTRLRARRDPGRTALVCGPERVDYATLEKHAARVAGALREAGIAPGWFPTGDIGRADHEDSIWIVDRKKDLIISGGENISSIEVEQAVVSNPRVEEAVVVGLPHSPPASGSRC